MLIGLNGQIGSGKDTFADRAAHLQAGDGPLGMFPTPERLAFADKLKNAFGALFGIDRDLIEELKRDDEAMVSITTVRDSLEGHPYDLSEPFTVRLGLQRMGTEVGRDLFGTSFWVDQCVPLDFDHADRLVFVTDCRFPNEADRIHDAGGIVVRVLNGSLEVDAGHASEQILGADLIDFEVDNSRRGDNFASLDEQVVSILRLVKETEHAVRHTHSVNGRRVISDRLQLDSGAPSWTRIPQPGSGVNG